MAPMTAWAPISWAYLHYVAASFPDSPSEQKRQNFVKFIEHVAEFLPCSLCGNHMQQYLRQNSVYEHTATREQLERYIYDLHENVNDQKGIPKENRPSFNEVSLAYRMGEASKKMRYPVTLSTSLSLATKNKILTPLLLTIGIVLLISTISFVAIKKKGKIK